VKKTRLGSASVLACVAGSVAVVHAAPEDSPWRTVRWQNANGVAAFDAARPVEAPAQALARLAGPESRVIVEFDEIPTPARRAALADAGVTLLAPLGGPAYFARIDADANPGLAARAAALRSVREIGRAHKIESKLVGAEAPAWALADRAQEGVENPVIGVYVQLHADVDPAADAVKQMIAGSDGVVRDTVESINTLVVELPWLSVPGLADDPRVQWVEAALPRMGTTNASNRVRVQADTGAGRPVQPRRLRRDGARLRRRHGPHDPPRLLGPCDQHRRRPSATTPRTSRAPIGGDGTANATHRGMAPGVTILGAGFQYDGSGTFLYTNPGDLEFDYGNGIAQGAVMSNNSIGSNIAPNGFPCAYRGRLRAHRRDHRRRRRRARWASPSSSSGPPATSGATAAATLYNTSPPPANNKNAITVGALNSNNDSMTSFSSWGPSDDGRIRPVISGPGCQSSGDGGVTSLDSDFDTDYTTLCGTSMASPTACGVGALIYEDFPRATTRAARPLQPAHEGSGCATPRSTWATRARQPLRLRLDPGGRRDRLHAHRQLGRGLGRATAASRPSRSTSPRASPSSRSRSRGTTRRGRPTSARRSSTTSTSSSSTRRAGATSRGRSTPPTRARPRCGPRRTTSTTSSRCRSTTPRRAAG
jgi:subtilisin family serine protease